MDQNRENLAAVKLGNRFRVGSTIFEVERAIFLFDATQEYPGWDFTIDGKKNDKLSLNNSLYGIEPRFYSECAPIDLESDKDLTGEEVYVKEAVHPVYGEPVFDFVHHEFDDLTEVRIKFLKRMEQFYRVHVTARIAKGLYSRPCRLEIETWIERLPDRL